MSGLFKFALRFSGMDGLTGNLVGEHCTLKFILDCFHVERIEKINF